MTERPILSVIIPVYNMERYIATCLSAILSLQDQSIEIIAVDDGSTDRTNDVLRSFLDRRLKVVTRPQGGPSAARNTGFKYARGRFILPFDADDIPIVENWPAILATLTANPDAVVVYGARRVFEADADNFPRIPSREVYPSSDEVIPLIFRKNFMQMGAAFIRREAIETAGPWNEGLWHGEDWDMWCRLACLGQFIHVPVLVIGYRRHAQSSTGTTVSRDAPDPGIAAIEAIYSNPSVLALAGADHSKLKNLALAWRTYYWGTSLIRSGAIWPGVKALAWAISRDPTRFLFLCSFPKRYMRRRLEQSESTIQMRSESDMVAGKLRAEQDYSTVRPSSTHAHQGALRVEDLDTNERQRDLIKISVP